MNNVLEYEAGKLIKWNGYRIERLDGTNLKRLIELLSKGLNPPEGFNGHWGLDTNGPVRLDGAKGVWVPAELVARAEAATDTAAAETVDGAGVSTLDVMLASVNRWKWSERADAMRINAEGHYVQFSDFERLARNYVELNTKTAAMHRELGAEIQKLIDTAMARDQEIAHLKGIRDFHLNFIERVRDAAGCSTKAPTDMIVATIDVTRDSLKAHEGKLEMLETLVKELTTFRDGVRNALGQSHSFSLSNAWFVAEVASLVTAVKGLRNANTVAESFKAGVASLLNVSPDHGNDVFYSEIAALIKEVREKYGLDGERKPVASMQSVGAITTFDIFELPEIELPGEPVGKAVFECTFEWARENWDLLVDSHLHKTIHNPANPKRQDGYIKIVTTS